MGFIFYLILMFISACLFYVMRRDQWRNLRPKYSTDAEIEWFFLILSALFAPVTLFVITLMGFMKLAMITVEHIIKKLNNKEDK